MLDPQLPGSTGHSHPIGLEEARQVGGAGNELDGENVFPRHRVTVVTDKPFVQNKTGSTVQVAAATIPFVPVYEQIQTAVTEYVRDYIRAQRRRQMSYKAIGDALGVSHVWAMQLDQPEKYGPRTVGPELELRVADLLHGGSVDALRRAALTVASGGAVVVERPGEHPLELTRASEPPVPPAAATPKGRTSRTRAR